MHRQALSNEITLNKGLATGQGLTTAKGWMPRVWITVLVGALCLSMVACQPLPTSPDGNQTGSETTVSEPAEAAAPESDSGEAEGQVEASDASNSEQGGTEMLQLSEVEQQLVTLAKDDIAAETGLSPDEMMVTSIQAADFADASLGCPEEGMMYAQVLTSGYELIIEVGGTQYEYHGSGQGQGRVVRCNK